MSALAKSTILTAALLVGVATSAYAQSALIAALPPGDQAAPAAAIAPVGPTASEEVFPNGPRDVWTEMARTRPLAPSPFLGPAPHSDMGGDSDD